MATETPIRRPVYDPGPQLTATPSGEIPDARDVCAISLRWYREPAKMEDSQKKQPVRKSILAGNSIGAILNQQKNTHEAAAESQTQEVDILVDPECERKIAASKPAFINELHRERPRIAMAMEEMAVDGNRISLKVPTEVLYEEIMRNRTEILTVLIEVAGIDGRVELDVTIEEDNKARKPIKVEDKLRFLTDKNSALTTLRRELNLEIE